MQNVEQNNSLFHYVDLIDKKELAKNNKSKYWEYGYNEEHDVVIISKDGTIGDIININGVNIALPLAPQQIFARSKKKAEQYWEPFEYPKPLQSIRSIFQWNDTPDDFKLRWVDFIEEEFDRRENGFWFMNNGTPTYITGSHYMYLCERGIML